MTTRTSRILAIVIVILLGSILLTYQWGALSWRVSDLDTPTTEQLPIETVSPVQSSPSSVAETATEMPPTATVTPTPTASHTPTDTPTSTNTPEPTSTPTPSMTPTPTATPTPWPSPQPGMPEVRVPILMYHYISVPPPGADVYRVNLSVPPDDFRAQLEFLKQNGYTTVDLYHVLDAVTWGRPLPDKPIVITMDDGYRDNYENAFPLLKEYGFTATFFVLTEPIDLGSERYMTWAQIEEMVSAGMGFEPHSKTHPDLRGRSHDFLVWEILGSAQTVQAHTARYPRFFAYPSAKFDNEMVAFLQEINFWGALVTWVVPSQNWENRYQWGRIRVSGGDSVELIADRIKRFEENQ